MRRSDFQSALAEIVVETSVLTVSDRDIAYFQPALTEMVVEI
jgi:hypothetical protein